MKYVVVSNSPPPVGEQTTFVDLGYLFAQKGAEVVSMEDDEVGKLFCVGANQGKGLTNTLIPELKDGVDDKLFDLLPDLKKFPEHWARHIEDYRISYQLLSYSPKVIYGWFDSEKFSTTLDLAAAMQIKAVNLWDTETLYKAQNYAMDNTLQF